MKYYNKKIYLFIMLLLVISVQNYAGQIAITIDDAPLPDSAYYNRNERINIIAEKLSKFKKLLAI